MKKYIFSVVACLSFLIPCPGQNQVSDTIQISYQYEVVLLFNEPISGVPRVGSAEVAKKTQLDDRTIILQSNAAEMKKKNVSILPNTSLTVKTSLGLYYFILTYKLEPDTLVITPDRFQPVYTYSTTKTEQSITQGDGEGKGVLNESFQDPLSEDTTEKELTSKELFKLLSTLNKKRATLTVPRQFNNLKMRMALTNIWVDNQNMYFKIVIENYSGVPYDINYFRYVTSYGPWSFKQKSDPIEDKRPAGQLKDTDQTITSGRSFSNIIAIKKFTLDRGQYFNIEVGEENGARKMSIPISRKVLIKAEPLNNL